MGVNAYPAGESPFEGLHEMLILHCVNCGCQWDAEGADYYIDEDGPTLVLEDEDEVCPNCGSDDFDWELIQEELIQD
jgi:hypothetical protein